MTTVAPSNEKPALVEELPHRPRVNPWLVAVIVLAAALIGLGAFDVVDRTARGGGGGATQDAATTTLDSFYAAVSGHADAATIASLFTSDAVLWSNGNEFVGAKRIGSEIASQPGGFVVKRLGPVTTWGNFATTYISFAVPIADLKAPMAEVVQLKNGKIFRLWDLPLRA